MDFTNGFYKAENPVVLEEVKTFPPVNGTAWSNRKRLGRCHCAAKQCFAQHQHKRSRQSRCAGRFTG